MAQLDAYLKALEIGLPIKQLRFKEQQARQEQQREQDTMKALQSIYGDEGRTVYLLHKSGIPLEDIEKTIDYISPQKKRQMLWQETMGKWQSAEKAQVATGLLKRMGVPQEGIDAILEQIYSQALPPEERIGFPLTPSQILDFYTPTKTQPTAEQRNLATRERLGEELGGLEEFIGPLTTGQVRRKGFLERELGLGEPILIQNPDGSVSFYDPTKRGDWTRYAPPRTGRTSLSGQTGQMIEDAYAGKTTPIGMQEGAGDLRIYLNQFKQAGIKKITNREALKADTGLTDDQIDWIESQL